MARIRLKSRVPLAIVLAMLIMLLWGYVLSIGPAGRTVKYKMFLVPEGIETWTSAYWPVLWITDRVPMASELLQGYLSFCGANDAANLVEHRTFFHEVWVPSGGNR